MITASQFQERLIEYLDGELSDTERREVEEYLRAHPEAARLEGDLALLSEAGRSLRESSYPADLLLEANRALAARFAAPSSEAASSRGAVPAFSVNGAPQTPGPTPAPHRRRWRPCALAAGLAAAAILLAAAASQKAAIAEVASSLLHRIRVSTDGEQWHGLVKKEGADGKVIYTSGMIHPVEEGDTIRVFLPEQGDTIRIPFPTEEGDTLRVIPMPSLEEAVDPEVQTSP